MLMKEISEKNAKEIKNFFIKNLSNLVAQLNMTSLDRDSPENFSRILQKLIDEPDASTDLILSSFMESEFFQNLAVTLKEVHFMTVKKIPTLQ